VNKHLLPGISTIDERLGKESRGKNTRFEPPITLSAFLSTSPRLYSQVRVLPFLSSSSLHNLLQHSTETVIRIAGSTPRRGSLHHKVPWLNQVSPTEKSAQNQPTTLSLSVVPVACARSLRMLAKMPITEISLQSRRLLLPRPVGIRSGKRLLRSWTCPITCWRHRLGHGRKTSRPSGRAGQSWNLTRLVCFFSLLTHQLVLLLTTTQAFFTGILGLLGVKGAKIEEVLSVDEDSLAALP
jgi:hypothetical protein